jgi:alkanesulfonate monooxygenase SsuD/methylene tetrahydromethanopterin reductase-like flavin-dependent oxidoreductase (luciferase family)
MELSVLVTSALSSAAAWTDLCRELDDLPVRALYVPDHFHGAALSPVPALAAAAVRTRSLRLAPLMVNNAITHPALIGRDIVTLAMLSGHRADLGLGMGWNPTDLAVTGRAPAPIPERLARLEASALEIRRMVTPARLRGAGSGLTGSYTPELGQDEAGIDIIMGGGGPRVLAMAAANADVVSINPPLGSGWHGRDAYTRCSHDTLRQQLAVVADVVARTGRPVRRQLVVTMVGVGAAADPAARACAAKTGMGTAGMAGCPHVLIGSRDAVAGKLHRIANLGIDEIVVRDDGYAALLPLLAG